METALRRRLEGVAQISISQHEQRAAVTFIPGTAVFSSEACRLAVAEADVEVITFDVRVCGVVDERGALRRTAGNNEPIVQLRGDVRPGSSICASGRLDDRANPYRLELVTAQPRG